MGGPSIAEAEEREGVQNEDIYTTNSLPIRCPLLQKATVFFWYSIQVFCMCPHYINNTAYNLTRIRYVEYVEEVPKYKDIKNEHISVLTF